MMMTDTDKLIAELRAENARLREALSRACQRMLIAAGALEGGQQVAVEMWHRDIKKALAQQVTA